MHNYVVTEFKVVWEVRNMLNAVLLLLTAFLTPACTGEVVPDEKDLESFSEVVVDQDEKMGACLSHAAGGGGPPDRPPATMPPPAEVDCVLDFNLINEVGYLLADATKEIECFMEGCGKLPDGVPSLQALAKNSSQIYYGNVEKSWVRLSRDIRAISDEFVSFRTSATHWAVWHPTNSHKAEQLERYVAHHRGAIFMALDDIRTLRDRVDEFFSWTADPIVGDVRQRIWQLLTLIGQRLTDAETDLGILAGQLCECKGKHRRVEATLDGRFRIVSRDGDRLMLRPRNGGFAFYVAENRSLRENLFRWKITHLERGGVQIEMPGLNQCVTRQGTTVKMVDCKENNQGKVWHLDELDERFGRGTYLITKLDQSGKRVGCLELTGSSRTHLSFQGSMYSCRKGGNGGTARWRLEHEDAALQNDSAVNEDQRQEIRECVSERCGWYSAPAHCHLSAPWQCIRDWEEENGCPLGSWPRICNK